MFSMTKSSIFLLLLLLLGFYSSNLFAAPLQPNMISLYNSNDKIVILVAKNFSSTIYQSETAWLVEFYASWCGHCQRYAKTYRQIGIDTLAWKSVVRIAAINCYAEENNPICDQHGVRAYPTIRLIEPHAVFNESKLISIAATDAKNVEKEMITQLESLHRKDSSWPNLTPMNLATFDDLLGHLPSTVKLTLIFVEDRTDFTGRQTMLDFSKFHQELIIYRTESNATVWKQLGMTITEKPVVFAVFPNRTVEKIDVTSSKDETTNKFDSAIRSYISKNNFISNINDREVEEISLSQNFLQNISKTHHVNSYQNRLIRHQKLSMVDFETALSYMLRREITRTKEIQGEIYDALVHWLIVLTKYFPGREPVMTYLKTVLSKVQDQPDGLTGSEFRKIADFNTETGFLPNNNVNYQFCAGSSPQYRGYPCALWILFHTLTVSQVQLETTISNGGEIPIAIQGFVKNFFGCQECSKNFLKETKDLNDLSWKEKNAAMIYMWKVHNSVNRRLHSEQNEDPKYPKVQFPPSTMCEKCHSNPTEKENSFNFDETIEFLQRFYAKENIDLSMVENSMNINELEEMSAKDSTVVQLVSPSSFFSSSSLFFFCILVVIVVVVRKRYCKSKIKRYTL